MTVTRCEVVGPDRWWWQVPKGSADQIALYNVEHFSVTDNISRNGGDCGVIIQDGRYGTVSGNTCIGNFGPGICITTPDPCFIHVNGNVSNNNCRRYKLKIGTSRSTICKSRTSGNRNLWSTNSYN